MRNPPLCSYRELCDGTYSLNQVADMHEAMDEEAEYEQRAKDAQEKKNPRRGPRR
jgi:ArsR family metal-binding transcriptional regulator